MKAKKIGIIGKKLGMTQLYDENGRITPVTVVDFSDMKVMGKRDIDRDGYSAVILGYDFREVLKKGEKREKARFVREIRLDDVSVFDDDKFGPAWEGISKVDVTGIMKGRGFAGAMKRHNFHGGPASHGSKTHRRVGSIGQCTFPAKVFKGKKMPGHMGNTKVTVLNQKLVRFDAEKRLLFIRGQIPGSKGRYVIVRDAIKG